MASLHLQYADLLLGTYLCNTSPGFPTSSLGRITMSQKKGCSPASFSTLAAKDAYWRPVQIWPPGCVSVSNGCGIHSACHSLAKIGPSRNGTSSPLGSQSLVSETSGTGLWAGNVAAGESGGWVEVRGSGGGSSHSYVHCTCMLEYLMVTPWEGP